MRGSILLLLVLFAVASLGAATQANFATTEAALLTTALTDRNATFVETPAPSPFETTARVTWQATSPRETTAVLVRCGDGLREGEEGCDDGNTDAGDGCSNNCTVDVGFECSLSSSGPDTCILQTSPQAGEVFVRSSTSVAGISTAEFVGAVRVAFRQGVADALALLISQVLIETVTRRRTVSPVQVDYRLVVSEAEGAALASKVQSVHADGTLAQILYQQGLNVSVELSSAPVVVVRPPPGDDADPPSPPPSSASAVPKATPQEGDKSSNAAVVASVVVVLLVLTCVCGAAFWYLRRKRARSARVENEAFGEHEHESGEGGKSTSKGACGRWLGCGCLGVCLGGRRKRKVVDQPGSDEIEAMENGRAGIPVAASIPMAGTKGTRESQGRSGSIELDAVVNHGPRDSGCSEEDLMGLDGVEGSERRQPAQLAELDEMALEQEREEEERVKFEARRVRMKVGRQMVRVLRVAEKEMKAEGRAGASACVDYDEFRRIVRNGGLEPGGYGVSEQEAGDEEVKLVFLAVVAREQRTASIRELLRYLEVKGSSKTAKAGSSKSGFKQWLAEMKKLEEEDKKREEEEQRRAREAEQPAAAEEEAAVAAGRADEEEEGRRGRAAVKIQARVRGAAGRQRAGDLKQERGGDAAGGASGEEEGDGEERRRRAAVKIQARARGSSDRARLSELRRHREAAEEQAEGEAHEDERRREGAAVKIQARARGAAGRKRAVELRSRGGPAESGGREEEEEDGGRRERAAIKIQSRARGMAGRHRAAGARQQRRGEEAMERERAEGEETRSEGREEEEEREKAAVRIQARARGMAGRRQARAAATVAEANGSEEPAEDAGDEDAEPSEEEEEGDGAEEEGGSHGLDADAVAWILQLHGKGKTVKQITKNYALAELELSEEVVEAVLRDHGRELEDE